VQVTDFIHTKGLATFIVINIRTIQNILKIQVGTKVFLF